ncbi:hypothetical protein AZA_52040 [Nitrospirillum viridazoti Y2]|nr:hypothetical protein AZA_52040 [Nitrospirillum amazonense Y2]
MGQDAGLGGDGETLNDAVDQAGQVGQYRQAVRYRVQADHGVAAAVEQPVQDAGRHAGGVVRRVVGLQPHSQRAGQADGVAEACDDTALPRRQDQILVAHDLGHGRRHLRRQAGGEHGQRVRRRLVRQQVVAEAADRQVRHRGEGGRVVPVQDQAGDLILLIGHQRLGQEGLKRQVGQAHLGGHVFLGRLGGDAGQPVARSGGRRLGHQILEIGEGPGSGAQGDAVRRASNQAHISPHRIHGGADHDIECRRGEGGRATSGPNRAPASGLGRRPTSWYFGPWTGGG